MKTLLPSLDSNFRSRDAAARESKPKYYAPASGMCPVCRCTFSTRLRLVAHLTDQRLRYGRTPCFQRVQPSMRITAAECKRLDELDRRSRAEARKAGKTQPKSAGPCKRLLDSLTFLVSNWAALPACSSLEVTNRYG